jgi:hypothetical protein
VLNIDKWWWNFAKVYIKKKAPKKGKEKKTRGKDKSLGKQIAQKKHAIHSLKIFNSSLFQLICVNDEMGLMLRINSYIKILC